MAIRESDINDIQNFLTIEESDGLEVVVRRSHRGEALGLIMSAHGMLQGVAEDTPAHRAGVAAAVGRVLTHVDGIGCTDVARGNNLIKNSANDTVTLRFSPVLNLSPERAAPPTGSDRGYGYPASSSQRQPEPQPPQQVQQYYPPRSESNVAPAAPDASGLPYPSVLRCAYCGSYEADWRCPCHLASYCSRQCQERDWSHHSQKCTATDTTTSQVPKTYITPEPRDYNYGATPSGAGYYSPQQAHQFYQ